MSDCFDYLLALPVSDDRGTRTETRFDSSLLMLSLLLCCCGVVAEARSIIWDTLQNTSSSFSAAAAPTLFVQHTCCYQTGLAFIGTVYWLCLCILSVVCGLELPCHSVMSWLHMSVWWWCVSLTSHFIRFFMILVIHSCIIWVLGLVTTAGDDALCRYLHRLSVVVLAAVCSHDGC